jgi:hypothetical protein
VDQKGRQTCRIGNSDVWREVVVALRTARKVKIEINRDVVRNQNAGAEVSAIGIYLG